MDQNQIRLVIEDMLRADIARDINITHRSVGFSNGSKTVTEWKQVINFNYQPKFYRLALIKHFFFELRIINTNKIKVVPSRIAILRNIGLFKLIKEKPVIGRKTTGVLGGALIKVKHWE